MRQCSRMYGAMYAANSTSSVNTSTGKRNEPLWSFGLAMDAGSGAGGKSLEASAGGGGGAAFQGRSENASLGTGSLRAGGTDEVSTTGCDSPSGRSSACMNGSVYERRDGKLTSLKYSFPAG